MARIFLVALLIYSLSPAGLFAGRPVQPREVVTNPPGTKVFFTRSVDYSRGVEKRIEVSRKAADKIIEFANQIKKHDRPVRARPFQEAPLGSFHIGEKTWLHLLEVGILEDPAYQGVRNKPLQRLAKQIADKYDNLTEQEFQQWIEHESKLESEAESD